MGIDSSLGRMGEIGEGFCSKKEVIVCATLADAVRVRSAANRSRRVFAAAVRRRQTSAIVRSRFFS